MPETYLFCWALSSFCTSSTSLLFWVVLNPRLKTPEFLLISKVLHRDCARFQKAERIRVSFHPILCCHSSFFSLLFYPTHACEPREIQRWWEVFCLIGHKASVVIRQNYMTSPSLPLPSTLHLPAFILSSHLIKVLAAWCCPLSWPGVKHFPLMSMWW